MNKNVYQFPANEDRYEFKKQVASKKLKRRLNGLESRTRGVLSGLFFWCRVAAANVLHGLTCLPFALLIGFRKALLWIGGIICVVTWYQLGHQFVSGTNYTIPFFIGLYVVSLVSPAILSVLNKAYPWHKLFALEPVRASGEDELQHAKVD